MMHSGWRGDDKAEDARIAAYSCIRRHMKRRQLAYHEGVGPSGAASVRETTMTPDFNLLITLDACWKRQVAGAARRLA